MNVLSFGKDWSYMDRKDYKRPLFTRSIIVLSVFGVLLLLLGVRLWYIQIFSSEKYRTGAFEQYTTEISISPKRGTIYDRNMTALAVSATVETVFISPHDIANQNKGRPEDKHVDINEKRNQIANFLSETLEVDRSNIMERMGRIDSKYQIIKKQVPRETADKIRKFIKEEKIIGIHLEDDIKREYPYGNLASHVIGHINGESVGVEGVESFYDNYLKGSSGKIVTAQNADGRDMPFKYESYVEAENGANVVLTIDWQIQSILEKHLEIALRDTKAKNRVFGIVVDVNTMEILAMSTKPDYDLNNPYELDPASQEKLDTFTGTEEEKRKLRSELLYGLWKNKTITEIYEPGSTFKLITSAMALEENVVSPSDTFYCSGYKSVGGYNIGCHQRGGHGYETFEQGLQNSCNPVFMDLAERIGKHKFYNYFEAYGFTEKTGIDLSGEVSGIYHTDINGFNQTELAVYSFGQTFKVTPLQQIRGVAAVANGGKIIKPRVVKALVDNDGNIIKSFDTEVIRTVNSEETSDIIMEYLMNGINMGSTKNAYVKGYKIAAKTGTSQKRDKEGNLYIGSCVAFAPADNPQIAILVGIDEPSNGDYYGGVIAAPVVSSVLTEVLPYLNIEPTLTDDSSANAEVAVYDYKNLSVESAKEIASNGGFRTKIIGKGSVVTEQLPRYGSKIPAGGVVVLYTDNIEPSDSVTVPDVTGYAPNQANKVLINASLNVKMEGAYRENVEGSVAVKQSPEAGAAVKPGTVVEVEFRHMDSSD